MSITKIRSGVSVSGNLKGLDDSTSLVVMIKTRLRRLYPEANQDVFSVIINPLIQASAHQVKDDTFKGIVKMILLEVATGMFPDRGFNDKTDYSVLYANIADHMKNKRSKIGAYQGNKIY